MGSLLLAECCEETDTESLWSAASPGDAAVVLLGRGGRLVLGDVVLLRTLAVS
jgi:hypothetical protein